MEGAVRAEITAYYGIPKSAGRRAGADMMSGKLRPTKKPDLDNVAKIVLDSLNGLAYQDDTVHKVSIIVTLSVLIPPVDGDRKAAYVHTVWRLL